MTKPIDESKFAGFLANPKDSGPKAVVFVDYSTDISFSKGVSNWMPSMEQRYTIKKPVDADHAVEVLAGNGWDPLYARAVDAVMFWASSDDKSLINSKDLRGFVGTAGDEEWFIEKWMLVKSNKERLSQLYPSGIFSPTVGDDEELICDLVKWKEVGSGKVFTTVLAWVVYLT